MTATRDLFTFGLYLAVGLASAMLWGAEGAFSQAALTLPMAVVAFLYVERRGLVLPNFVANGLGLAAIGVAFVELWLRDIEGRLLFGAHLLVYLTWILLWLPKAPRQRWGLIALAVLQVGVGSVLTNNGLYGFGMAAFLTLTVWTLVLFQLDDAESRHAPAALPPVAVDGRGRPAALLLGRGDVTPAGRAAFGRWPMRQLAAATAVTVAGAVVVGAGFFLLIPRFEIGRRGFEEADSPLARQRTTGFTETVRLGEFGQILESTVPVFDVRIFEERDSRGNSRGGSRIDVAAYARSMGQEEPLFRGTALSVYDRGEWKAHRVRDYVPLQPGTRSFPRVRQEYRIQPLGSDVLFAIPPVLSGYVPGAEDPVQWRSETRTIERPGRRYAGELNYVIVSPRSAELAPRRGSGFTWLRDSFSGNGPDDVYLSLPNGLDRVREVAAGVARPGGEDAVPGVRAERLTAYLRDTGGFTYSLSGAIEDPRLDPVEDFLVNRKAGHCEYFASALALMLRAEGIPCRVVSGFKGGEVNRLSGAFEVQQRHAHTWVEAWLDDRWQTLDPTPAAARNQVVAANASLLPLWNELLSAGSSFWRSYVVQMNLTQQRRTLAPLREAATSAAAALREDWWPALRRQAYVLATDPRRWFSWQGGVATFVLLLLGVSGWRLAQTIARVVERTRAARRAQALRGRRVEFYERFRRLCERRGWRARLAETPREFAAGVMRDLAVRALPPRLAVLPGELTEDFYRVRFGDLDLPERQVRELDERLGELEAALAGGTGR